MSGGDKTADASYVARVRRIGILLATVVLASVSALPGRASAHSGVEIKVGSARPALVVLPSSAKPVAPRPLLIALHGFNASGRALDATLHLRAATIAHGLVLALPDGTRVQSGGPRFWNSTDACCNYVDRKVDDVAYLTSLIDLVAARTPIDRKRVYLLGYSNGGFMAYRLACEQAADFAAIAVLSAGTYDKPSQCAPAKPVSLLHIHGTADPIVAYDGGFILAEYPGAKASVRMWAGYDGCSVAEGMHRTGSLDVNAGVPGRETTSTAYACPKGIGVTLWSVQGGTHSPNVTRGFATLVVDWLLRHHR